MAGSFRGVVCAVGVVWDLSAQPIRLSQTPARPMSAGPHGESPIEVEVDGFSILSRSTQIQIDLRGASSVIAERLRYQLRGSTGAFWRGKLTFEPTSDVVLTWHKGVLAGATRPAVGVFEIRPSRGGAVIEKLNMGSFPACGGAVPPGPNFAADVSSAVPSAGPGTPALEGSIEIALLSVYTPQARDAAGDVAQIEAQIHAAVDNANPAFQNSQVAANYTLVHAALANYNDSGNARSDLSWVASDAAVAALRNQYGAYMVSLITSDGGGACGIEYVMRSGSSSFAPYAFQVTDRDCAVGNLTFAHEHGHDSGLQHDLANGTSPSSAPYQWSFGHFVNGQFRTVMSYATPCSSPCSRVAHYSNPSVTYMGYAAGTAEQRDHARTLRSTTPVVTASRGSAPGTPPAGC
jgi:peptidyl-Asp metalloendopeptidase